MGSKVKYAPWPPNVVEGVADVLGEMTSGLSGTTIGELLRRIGIEDPYPGITKRHRLREALLARQHKDQASNCIIRFIVESMDPVRYRDNPALFRARQDELNDVLVHAGLRINEKGEVCRGPQAETLSEAARHANSLRSELRRRGAHSEVLRYCSVELLQKN